MTSAEHSSSFVFYIANISCLFPESHPPDVPGKSAFYLLLLFPGLQ